MHITLVEVNYAVRVKQKQDNLCDRKNSSIDLQRCYRIFDDFEELFDRFFFDDFTNLLKNQLSAAKLNSAKRSFASKIKILDFFMLRAFLLRFAQLFLRTLSGQLIGDVTRKG